MSRYLELLVLKENKLPSLSKDLLAALTVAVLVIPQGMAYAVLAGFPPIYGLYTCLAPLVLYPIFGTSPYLSIGPVAIISVLLASGLTDIAIPCSEEYIVMGIFVGLVAGVFQVLLSLFRMGSIVNFLSHPVLSGFTSAAGIIIISSQLASLLGIDISRCTFILDTFKELAEFAHTADIASISIGLISLFGIIILKRINKRIPASLVFVLVMSLIIYFFKLDSVKILGEVPTGLPSFLSPLSLDYPTMKQLIPLGIVIGLVSFVESIAIAKSLGNKSGIHSINSNKELLAIGMSKVGGAFFQSIPSSSSFSRSAINESAGAKSGWSSIMAASIVAISLLLFTEGLSYIPYPVLAALIIAAVIKLIDYKEAIRLYKQDRSDFLVWAMTFLVTLALGVQSGIFSGIILSIILILKRVSSPHVAVLGKINNDGIYKNINRFSHAETVDHILIIRYDSDIFFGNADHFYDSVNEALAQKSDTKCLILDLSSVASIDSTGIYKFKLLIDILQKNNINLQLAGAIGPLRDRMHSEGVFDLIGIENHSHSVEKAVEKVSSQL